MEEMMEKMRRLAVLPIAMLVLAACQAADPGGGSAAAGDGACAGEVDGHLARVCEAGVLVVSTDPAYPPQSFLNEETGEYEGFDIDVARAIAEGLGVEVEFTDP